MCREVLMADSAFVVLVQTADTATLGLVEAFARLLPQLSTSAPAPTLESLAAIIAAPSNTVSIARDPIAGGRIVGTLTLVIFPIPTALRAWIEDVVVDNDARARCRRSLDKHSR